jgi:hypothetical protein
MHRAMSRSLLVQAARLEQRCAVGWVGWVGYAVGWLGYAVGWLGCAVGWLGRAVGWVVKAGCILVTADITTGIGLAKRSHTVMGLATTTCKSATSGRTVVKRRIAM